MTFVKFSGQKNLTYNNSVTFKQQIYIRQLLTYSTLVLALSASFFLSRKAKTNVL